MQAHVMRRRLTRFFARSRAPFSLARLAHQNPALAEQFLWRTNRLPPVLQDPLWLHLGSGENVLDGFLNLDFLPHDARVAEWDMLDPWPASWPTRARGALSEDMLEHFFLAEQLYILCELNRALAAGATFRLLMPSLARLRDYCQRFAPRPGELLHDTFAVETEADALNAGMRFSGHRWLHDDASVAHLARLAGFAATRTTCRESREPFLCERNLRDEDGTAAFAHDLVKERAIERLVVADRHDDGLEGVETVRDGIALLRVARTGARLRYQLPRPLPSAAIACVDVRSANVSAFREHSLKRFVVRGAGADGAFQLDETLKSKACMNLLTPAALRLALGGADDVVHEIALEPGRPGELVTAGPLELFVFADA
jgi:hypothetical protein